MELNVHLFAWKGLGFPLFSVPKAWSAQLSSFQKPAPPWLQCLLCLIANYWFRGNYVFSTCQIQLLLGWTPQQETLGAHSWGGSGGPRIIRGFAAWEARCLYSQVDWMPELRPILTERRLRPRDCQCFYSQRKWNLQFLSWDFYNSPWHMWTHLILTSQTSRGGDQIRFDSAELGWWPRFCISNN